MKQIYKILLALVAVLVSLGFIVMAGAIFPKLYLGAADMEGNLDFFRQDLIDRAFTTPLALMVTTVPWLLAAVYYYVVNSVHLDRWWHWMGILVIGGILSGVASWEYLNTKLSPEGLDEIYSPYIFSMGAWCALIGAILFILASFGIRWWSSNCRHTPIPQ